MKMSHAFCVLPLTLLIGLFGCNRSPRVDEEAATRADASRLEELRAAERNAAGREASARDAERDLARRNANLRNEELKRENAALAVRAKEAEDAAERSRAASDASERKSAEAKTEQTLDFFYDALEPHGDWIEVADYGFAWQPRANSDLRWRPYLDGHWAWTDYGWTWVSNEPFGWATYHYGRWARLKRLGWVWVPGSEWAPAWVAWRSSDRLVGWAPLPPEAYSGAGFSAAVDNYYDIGPAAYAFLPFEEFGGPTYLGKIEEPSHNVTVVNQTVNITKITYRNVQNKTVVHNDGPSLDLINRRSKTPVRTLKLERNERPAPARTTLVAERDSDLLRLPAPHIRPASKADRPPRQVKEHARREEVNRGWEGADPENIKRAKEHQARDARRAEAEQEQEQEQPQKESTPPASSTPAVTAAPPPPAATPPERHAPQTPAREKAKQPVAKSPGRLPATPPEGNPRRKLRDAEEKTGDDRR
jgi:hypothetical protein